MTKSKERLSTRSSAPAVLPQAVTQYPSHSSSQPMIRREFSSASISKTLLGANCVDTASLLLLSVAHRGCIIDPHSIGASHLDFALSPRRILFNRAPKTSCVSKSSFVVGLLHTTKTQFQATLLA